MAYLLKYFLAAMAGIISFLFLYLMTLLTWWWLFLLLLLVWLAFLVYLNRFKNKHLSKPWQTTPLLLVTALAIVSLLSLVDWEVLQWFLLVLVALIITWLFWLTPVAGELAYKKKPVRRALVMIWVFDVFAFWSSFFALNLFFPKIPFWLLSLGGSILTGYISLMIWQMYFAVPFKNLLLRLVVLSLVVWELTWVIQLLPLGYLVLGFLVTWAWYLSQLLIRFHISPKGIVWRRQISFLISNLVLYFLFLFFFVRWL